MFLFEQRMHKSFKFHPVWILQFSLLSWKSTTYSCPLTLVFLDPFIILNLFQYCQVVCRRFPKMCSTWYLQFINCCNTGMMSFLQLTLTRFLVPVGCCPCCAGIYVCLHQTPFAHPCIGNHTWNAPQELHACTSALTHGHASDSSQPWSLLSPSH